jgi:HK97 family phage portal protein
MGLLNLARQLPKGIRVPEPAITDSIDGSGSWWGPTFNQLPWSSDGSVDPIYMNSWGDAEAAAMSIPAAWRAMNLIAGTIAQMPLVTYDRIPLREAKTVQAAYRGRVSDLELQVVQNPWPMVTYYNWMFMVVVSVVLRGNFYGVLSDYDPATGWPRQIIPVAHDDITLEVKDGIPWYHVDGMDRWLRYDEVFHVRGFMTPGMLKGIGVIEAHRGGLTSIRGLMDFGTGAYMSGGVPPVIMTIDKPEITEAEAEYLQSRWVSRHTVRDRRPAVVPKIVDIKTVGLSMQDAEYLQSRQFSVAEIAWMFNLDPEDLSAGFGESGGNMRYMNNESRTRDRLIFSLNCWINRIEESFSYLIPGDHFVKMYTDELLRADTATRMKNYAIGLANGIYTVNEVRAMEGLGPLPGGDIINPRATAQTAFPEFNHDDEPDEETAATNGAAARDKVPA